MKKLISYGNHTINQTISPDFLTNVLDALDDPVFVKDQHHRWVFFNDSACKAIGKPREELLGKTDHDLFPKEQADIFWERDDLVFQSGKTDVNEEVITWQGKIHILSTKKSLYIDPKTGEKYVVGTIRDITSRVVVEDKLKHRIKMESLVGDISKHLISLPPDEIDRGIEHALLIVGEYVGVDRSYIFQFNDNVTRMSNTHEWCSQGIDAQKNKLQDLATNSFPWWMEKMHRFENIIIPEVEKLPPEAGAEKELLQMQNIISLVTVPMCFSGSLIGFLGFDWVRRAKSIMSEDINVLKLIGEVIANALKRKQVDHELWAEREQLISIFNSIDEIIYITDPYSHELMFANNYLKSLLGKNPIGEKCYRVLQGLNGPCEFCTNHIILKNKYAPYTWEFHNSILNRDFSIIDKIIKWPDGRDVRFELAIDITEQKKLADQLQQAQKMEAVGRLAGGIAHDFNNILTAVTGYAQILMMDSTLSHKHRAYIEELSKSAARATSLTQQLLAFSRKQVLQPKVLNMNALVTDITKILKRLIGEDIDLSLKLEQDLDSVKVDRGQIEQVIMNIAVNARDAMPNGGKLIIETKNIHFEDIFCAEHCEINPGNYILLSISDNGCGMDEETIKHIYDPFFTTKETGKGTGLGLSMVYGIVKQSGGHIHIYSEPNRGTSFEIYFPHVEEVHDESDRPPDFGKHLKGSEKILLVEDEEDVRNLVHTCLKTYGYDVLPAENGQKALQICEQVHALDQVSRIKLLITDVIMPDISGRALSKKIENKYPPIKTLYMSGYTNEAIGHHGILDEGIYFIQKPFTPEALAKKVREVLDSA